MKYIVRNHADSIQIKKKVVHRCIQGYNYHYQVNSDKLNWVAYYIYKYIYPCYSRSHRKVSYTAREKKNGKVKHVKCQRMQIYYCSNCYLIS